MNEGDVWKAIDAQRLTTADLLERLTDDEWRHPSLCDGWSVRDVAAHLTLQQTGLWTALGMSVRSPGGMKRMIHDSACRRAGIPTEQMIAEIRGMVGSRKHNIGVTYRETLIDILVHGQDIALPLGRPLSMPPHAAAVAASRVWSIAFPFCGYPFFPRKKLKGVRLMASDTEWNAGQGPGVHGPIGAILLLLTGRLAALSRLSGDGVPTLRARLTRLPAP